MSSHGSGQHFRNRLLKQRGWPLLLALFALIFTVSLSHSVSAYSNAATANLEQPNWEGSVQIAQDPNTQQNSTLYFNTPTYVVSVYPRDGNPLRMNVYNKFTRELEQENAPVTYRGPLSNTPWVTYESYGSRNRQNVVFQANANKTTNQASLNIVVQATNASQVQENSTSITAINVPVGNAQAPGNGNSNQPPSYLANTILYFDTRTFTTRVFNEGGIRKMNIYNKLTQQTDVNGKVATLVNPTQAPYQNWVSYYGGESFNGIAGRFFARVNGSGEAVLQFIDGTGRTVLEERREGPLVVNIPPSEVPSGVDTPAASANQTPYVAAVFGDEQTLQQVRGIAPQAQFESSRLGRFINAGSFTSRDEAASLVSLLKSRGFNSRLVYRDVNYR